MNEDVFGWVIVNINMLLNKDVFDVRGIRFGVEFGHIFCPSDRDDVAYAQILEQRNGAGSKATNAAD